MEEVERFFLYLNGRGGSSMSCRQDPWQSYLGDSVYIRFRNAPDLFWSAICARLLFHPTDFMDSLYIYEYNLFHKAISYGCVRSECVPLGEELYANYLPLLEMLQQHKHLSGVFGGLMAAVMPFQKLVTRAAVCHLTFDLAIFRAPNMPRLGLYSWFDLNKQHCVVLDKMFPHKIHTPEEKFFALMETGRTQKCYGFRWEDLTAEDVAWHLANYEAEEL